MTVKIRRYGELLRLSTFEERYDYLALSGVVGKATFGYDRYINQKFYQSTQWRNLRSHIIVRDNGCDLGIFDREIYGPIFIHHMNPMDANAIVDGDPDILNPEYLISVTHTTHNAIHYGDKTRLANLPVERRPGDTKLW